MTSPFDPNLAANLPPRGPRRIVYLEANRAPRTGTGVNDDTKYRDGSYYEPNTEWRDLSTSPPTIWKLAVITSKIDAVWFIVSGANGNVIYLTDQVGTAVPPSGVDGHIQIKGNTVATGANPSSIPIETVADAINNILNVQLQVSKARTGSPVDKNDAGIASFDDTAFDVTGDGYVTLKGGSGPTVDTVTVSFETAPGVLAVTPNGSGNITITGNTVANATNAASPVATHSRGLNAFDIDVQVAAAVAPIPADKNDAGLASFDESRFEVTSNGFVTMIGGADQIGSSTNLGIAYSSPTFRITSASGTALSSSNPAYIVVPSNVTKGKAITFKLTSDLSFQDSTGTSDVDNNLWGTTTGVAWSPAVPFFIYAVIKTDDTLPTFMISRIPQVTTSPVAGKIAKSGSAVASTQGSFFALDSSITVADYASSSCLSIGVFFMSKTAGDDWTVNALGSSAGIGLFGEGLGYQMPADQNGAVRMGLSSSVGGDTIPTPNNHIQGYALDKSGQCRFIWDYDSITISGVGAGNLRVHLPFVRANGVNFFDSPPGHFSNLVTATGLLNSYVPRLAATSAFMTYYAAGLGGAILTPADVIIARTGGSASLNFLISTS